MRVQAVVEKPSFARSTVNETGSVAAIILGGGAGTRLYPLTKQRAKPAVPIGGSYRLIDVPMSNCINSGINKIYVLTQFNSMSLNRHISRTYNFGTGVKMGGFLLAKDGTLPFKNMLRNLVVPTRQLWHKRDGNNEQHSRYPKS